MHRRHALRLLAAAGAGTLAFGIPWSRTGTADAAWFMVTSEPGRDLRRLADVLGIRSLESWHMTATSIAPSRQDLTFLRTTDARTAGIVDPADVAQTPMRIHDLALALRRRSVPGTTLLTVEPERTEHRDVIRFEVDGRTVESVRPDRSWNRIEIDGLQGRTIFRLENGRLQVTQSSCRHELCRRFGARSDGRIICAPNRLVAHLPAPAGTDHVIAGLAGISG